MNYQRKAVAQRIRTIFKTLDKADAMRALNQAIEQWQKEVPKLASWAEENLIEGLTVCDFPAEHRICLRTTNCLERINKEIKRRTRVASIFPNIDSCLRLFSALLAEQDEEWLMSKVYLKMSN